MPGFLRQSTASQSRAIGPFLDDTDFKTAETGLTIANTDIKLVVNGGASANKNSGGGTHRVNGVYGVTFDATDTATVGEMEVSVIVSGALPVFDKFFVVEEAVYDMLFAASALGYIANAPVNVAQFGGSNGTFASGRPEVNTSHIAGSSVSTSSAQIGVNVVNFGGSAGTFASGRPEVNVSHFGGSAGTFSSGRPEVNTTHAAGTAWGSGAITAASIATGAITSAKFAAGAIDAAAIADNAIDAGSIAASALNGKGDWNIGKTGYSLTQTFPSNFSSLAITAAGKVTVGTNDDKTGYSLSQSFPSNFSSLAITAGGAVTVGTNGDKTGYALTSAYDAAKTAAQAGDAMTLTGAYDFAKGTSAMTESYAANGAAPTPVQAIMGIHQMLMQFAISGTTLTVKKLDNSTTAFEVTLDDATSPSGAERV